MKVYIEEIEELSAHGVTNYSLVRGMQFYDADVRASGVTILNRDGTEVENEEVLSELQEAMHNHLATSVQLNKLSKGAKK